MWLVGVVSRRWVWLVGVGGIYGVATGCDCKEVYRFPHIYYLSLLLLYWFFFVAASLLFVHLKKCFSLLFQYFFVIKLCIK